MSTFLESQELQKPLFLETGWLVVGHVDEFVQFLPSSQTDLGFTIAIADTKSAMKIYQDISSAGNGKFFHPISHPPYLLQSRTNKPSLARPGYTRAISFNGTVDPDYFDPEDLKPTVDDMLSNKTFLEVNAYAQKHVDMNLETLLSEIPLAREHVIHVPTLFKDSPWLFGRTGDGLPSHFDELMEGEHLLVAFSPAAINGVVLGETYLAATPWGPKVDGVDQLAEAVGRAYAEAGMEVVHVDDFLSHHIFGGEVHCGSNTLREADVAWWG